MAGRISYYGNIVKDGLVLCLDAAKRDSYPGVGTAWNDISGFRNNGVLTNGPTFNGANGGSIVFDGVDDRVSLGNVSVLNFITPFSIGCWFNAALVQPSVDSALMGNIGSYTNYMLWYNNNTVDLYFNNGIRANSSTIITRGIWYFVVGVWTGTDVIIYLNGSLNVSSPYSTPPGANTPNFTLGYYAAGAPRNFAGNISYAHAYNRALSATEILQNYNATKTRYL